MWDPILAKEIKSLEMLQHKAIQFIARLRRQESFTEACSKFGLQPLKQKRKNHRLSLLIEILQDEERHLTLLSVADETTRDHQKVTMTTRSAARGDMTSLYLHMYTNHGSFQPRDI